MRRPENPENPSPRVVPLNSSSPVTRTWSPGNSSATALQVPTTASTSNDGEIKTGTFMFCCGSHILSICEPLGTQSPKPFPGTFLHMF